MLFSPQIVARSRVTSSGGGGGGGTTASNFLARTSGLDATHIAAYTALLNGLDADGLTAKLDMLHIYATQTSATALLNLISTSYTGVIHGSPNFTADQGFASTESGSTDYIDTQFTPATATSPKYVQDSAHITCTNLTDATSSRACIGVNDTASSVTFLVCRDASLGQVQVGINSASIAQVTNSGSAVGFYACVRPDNAKILAYKSGSGVTSNVSATSTPVANRNLITLGSNNSGTIATTALRVAHASIGASLSATDVANYHSRIVTYMAAVGATIP